jgi:hypothetical protein
MASKIVVCDICGDEYSTRNKSHHMKSKNHTSKIPNYEYEYNCEKCHYSTDHKNSWNMHEKSNTHLLSAEECKIIRQNQSVESNKIAYENEIYITGILEEYIGQQFQRVIRIGNISGHKYDIKFKIKDENFERAIQVKSLSKKQFQNNYVFNLGEYDCYDDETFAKC